MRARLLGPTEAARLATPTGAVPDLLPDERACAVCGAVLLRETRRATCPRVGGKRSACEIAHRARATSLGLRAAHQQLTGARVRARRYWQAKADARACGTPAPTWKSGRPRRAA